MLWLAERLNAAGYDVIAFDARAHGDSEGDLCTVGDLEGADAIAVVREAKSDSPCRIRAWSSGVPSARPRPSA